MVAHLLNIQDIFTQLPDVFSWEGIPYDGYDKFTDLHFAHGWRTVEIPPFNSQTQKLSELFVIKNDIVTKDVIDLTDIEIEANYRKTIPDTISNMDLKIQLLLLGITIEEIVLTINSIPTSMFSVIQKQIAIIKLKEAVSFDRYNADLNLVATLEGLTQVDVDTIFKNLQ